MRYSELQPTHQLSEYVRCYWTLVGEPDDYDAESVAPDGSIEIILNLAKPFRRYHSDGQTELQPTTIVVGQMRRAVVIKPTGRVDILGVRFLPHGFYKLKREATDEFTDRIVGCSEIWGRSIERLEDKVRKASSTTERIRFLEEFLLGLIRRHARPARAYEQISAAVGLVQSSRGQQPVGTLAKAVGMSPRHLERQFKAIVGLSPKALGRIIRFQSALGLIRRGEIQSAEIACYCGYYDQAHLIHDFTHFSDQLPSTYLAGEQRLSHYFVQNESVSDFSNT